MGSAKMLFNLTWLFMGAMAETDDLKISSVRQESGFVSVKAGDSFTLRCFDEGEITVTYYWYKQTLGQKPKLISTFYKYQANVVFHDEFHKSPRFTVDAEKGKNHLTISDMRPSDSATYYCAGSYSYKFEIAEGMTIDVKGSGLNIQALIHQSVSEDIWPGGSVTLNCVVHTGNCDGEHSLYWFKNSEESPAGLIYTQGGKTDQCEKKPDAQTRTCVYNLPISSLNESHAGTYYCAVASCGHILFGNGTKLGFRDEVASYGLMYVLSGAVLFASVVLVFFVCVIDKINSFCTESCAGFSDPSTKSNEADQNEDTLCYSAERKNTSRSRIQRDDTWSQCVYFKVKH